METIRILVAEDHPLLRKGMISLRYSVAGFEVVGEATTGGEAAARAAELQPDVILMDLQMPNVNCIETTRRKIQAGIIPVRASGLPQRRTLAGPLRAGSRASRVM